MDENTFRQEHKTTNTNSTVFHLSMTSKLDNNDQASSTKFTANNSLQFCCKK